MEMIEDPEITCCERTGYPSWMQENPDDIYCGECGKLLVCDEFEEDVYETRTHSALCEDCLKMLHKKYV